MKKAVFCFVAVAAMVASTFTACDDKEVKFETIKEEGVVKRASTTQGTEEEEKLEYRVSFTYPSRHGDKAVLKALQEQFIRYTLKDMAEMTNNCEDCIENNPPPKPADYSSLAPKKAMAAYIDDLKNEYRDRDYLGVREFEIVGEVTFSNEALLQLKTRCFYEFGGAHPMGLVGYYLFDLKTGKEYTRDEVFKPEAAENIKALIIAELRKEADEANIMEDAVWREDVNFGVTRDSIFIEYNKYEIFNNARAASVAIPYSKIMPYLRDGTPVWEVGKKAAGGVGAAAQPLTVSDTQYITETCFVEIWNDGGSSDDSSEDGATNDDFAWYMAQTRDILKGIGVSGIDEDKEKRYRAFALDNGKQYVVDTKTAQGGFLLYKKGAAPIDVAIDGPDMESVKKYLGLSASTGQAFTDARDGKTYKTVKIGEQTWMAQNLNFETGNSWCYEDDGSNCEKYGRLYDWETAKTVCPAGWHLPSNEEWGILENSVGSAAGTKLKSTIGWNDYNRSSGNGTDEYGFSALPGGYRGGYSDSSFYYTGDNGRWWTATEDGAGIACYRYMSCINGYVLESINGKVYGFSVRCVEN